MFYAAQQSLESPFTSHLYPGPQRSSGWMHTPGGSLLSAHFKACGRQQWFFSLQRSPSPQVPSSKQTPIATSVSVSHPVSSGSLARFPFPVVLPTGASVTMTAPSADAYEQQPVPTICLFEYTGRHMVPIGHFTMDLELQLLNGNSPARHFFSLQPHLHLYLYAQLPAFSITLHVHP